MTRPSTPAELIARFAKKPLLSVPGERYHYSGLEYSILAQVIEAVSGSLYSEFLQREVFTPLRTNETGDDPEMFTNGRYGLPARHSKAPDCAGPQHAPSKEDYAYGWRTQTVHGRRRLGHGGALPSFASIIRRFPEEKVCLIVLSNTDSDVGRIADDLEAMVFDIPVAGPGR